MFAQSPGSHRWVFDLVAPDDAVRHRALTRHQGLIAAASDALSWSNRIWARAGTPAPAEPHLAAEMDQARTDFRWHREQTILGPLDAYWEARRTDAAAQLPYLPYLVLYLRWEMGYPQEWGAPDSSLWSAWGWKERVLDSLDRDGVPAQFRPQIGDLIVAAVRRPYRCKDWMYARLVRHVSGTLFGGGVEALLDAEDPVVRLRAQFVRHVARHPECRVKRVSWHRWLASNTDDCSL